MCCPSRSFRGGETLVGETNNREQVMYSKALVSKLSIMCLVAGPAFGDSDLAVTLLEQLRNRPVPSSMDATFMYSEEISPISKESALESDTIKRLQHSLEEAEKGEGPLNQQLQSARKADLDRQVSILVNGENLRQRQRVRIQSGQSRWEVVEDLGSRSDPKDALQAEGYKKNRTAIYFSDGDQLGVDYNPNNKTANILPMPFAAPDFQSMQMPSYSAEDLKALLSGGAKVTTVEKDKIIQITISVPGVPSSCELDIEMSDIGPRLSEERIVLNGEVTKRRTLSDYREVDGDLVPFKVVTWDKNKECEFQIEDVQVNHPIDTDVFDYRKVIKPGVEVFDARFNPPMIYKVETEDRVLLEGEVAKWDDKVLFEHREETLNANLGAATSGRSTGAGDLPKLLASTVSATPLSTRILIATGICVFVCGLIIVAYAFRSRHYLPWIRSK